MFSHATAIGADIGHNSIKIALVKYSGEISLTDTVSLDSVQTRDYLVAKLTEAIRNVRQKAASKGINPMCVGVSAKGFIDQKSGIILGPDRGIKDWKDVPLAAVLSSNTGLPAFIGNDANMMTIAEHRFGAARGFSNVVFVSLRTGIGGGIIINGKLYRGMNNAGGEFGQMIINFDDGISNLGIKGSFEHLASATAVERRYAEETGAAGNRKMPGCREIFELGRNNDPVAARIIRENAWIVGIGLANMISVFAPEIILIGGGMAEAGPDYISMIRNSAFENSLENCRADVKVEKARLGAAASIMGASYAALTRLAGKTI